MSDRTFKLTTSYVATRGVEEYRESIQQWVTDTDDVLELGCEWGTTTKFLAQKARSVIGTDISAKCIKRARLNHPDIRFEVLDGFDVLSAQALGRHFDKVYMDLSGFSGYRSLLDVVGLLTMYSTVLTPRAIIIKSGSLKHFASHSVSWSPAADSDARGSARRSDSP